MERLKSCEHTPKGDHMSKELESALAAIKEAAYLARAALTAKPSNKARCNSLLLQITQGKFDMAKPIYEEKTIIPVSLQKCAEAFERWVIDVKLHNPNDALRKSDKGEYFWSGTALAWRAWSAAWNSRSLSPLDNKTEGDKRNVSKG